jgi:hypothetical protein
MRPSGTRTIITAAAILVVVFDLLVAARLYLNGYPKRLEIADGIFTVRPIPFTGIDWLVSLIIFSVQAALFHQLWRSWRRPPVEGLPRTW